MIAATDQATLRNDAPVTQTQRPDVLFVIGSLNVGGTERHVSEIAPALEARGYRVSVFCLTDLGPFAEELTRKGIEVLGPPVPRARLARWTGPLARYISLVLTAGRLLGLMTKRRPRIVQCFLPAAILLGVPLARLTRIECVCSSRRSLNNYQDKYPILGRLDRAMHRCVDAIITNSEASATQLTDEEGVPPSKVHVIHNGIDPARLRSALSRADARAALNLDDSALVLVILANLISYKGHLDLISALERTASKLPKNWVLLIVGRDDGMGAEIAETANKAGFSANVRIMGNRTDIADILLAADIGLLVSHEEGFPNVILEYMAAALPVIATAVGGNPEAVADGKTGLLIPPSDPERLADALLRLSRDAGLRRNMGRAGHARVRELFSLESCVERHDRLYRQLLNSREK